MYRCFKMFSRQLSPVQQRRRPGKIRQNRNILALCITKTISLFSQLPYYVVVIYKPQSARIESMVSSLSCRFNVRATICTCQPLFSQQSTKKNNKAKNNGRRESIKEYGGQEQEMRDGIHSPDETDCPWSLPWKCRSIVVQTRYAPRKSHRCYSIPHQCAVGVVEHNYESSGHSRASSQMGPACRFIDSGTSGSYELYLRLHRLNGFPRPFLIICSA